MTGPEIVKGVNIDLAPGAKEGLAPRTRLGCRHRLHHLRYLPAHGNGANRGHARIDEHDFLVARGVSVKLFMPEMKTLLDLGDQRRRVEIDAIEGHIDLEDLLAIAHLGRALDLDRSTEPAAQPFDRVRLKFGEDVAD